MPSDNPAIVLRDILRKVMGTGSDVHASWVHVLGADVGTDDFSLRHCEIIAVWRQVYDLIFALPEGDDDRSQYLGLMSHYYTAIVYPDAWTNPSNKMATRLIVDQLTGIASTIKYRALAAPSLTDDSIARLYESITEWRDILDQADFEEKLKAELHAQVDHLEWLLDNVNLLGSSPVVEASKKLAGTSLVAMQAKPSFAKRIGKATAAALAAIALFHAGVDDVVGVIEGVSEMRHAVVEIFKPQDQLEPPPAMKELTAGGIANDPESPTTDDGSEGWLGAH
ncbi:MULTISPECIES: hypothetical protein [Mycobacteriaceae]|uniref:hypothetical protein n=1 Tax=Mycobacteriaceae TaxID=1762 RepID=UPI00056A1B73|nr:MULTISPECIES: hypothetical protein [Mycobacteriaceae]AXK74254.1 hypothetical protein DXK33_03070 [Mycolicibacterium neoaurum]KUM09372.1 hypothetical protein AVZ31_06960 [Mycolicibacterium neoaurum]